MAAFNDDKSKSDNNFFKISNFSFHDTGLNKKSDNYYTPNLNSGYPSTSCWYSHALPLTLWILRTVDNDFSEICKKLFRILHICFHFVLFYFILFYKILLFSIRICSCMFLFLFIFSQLSFFCSIFNNGFINSLIIEKLYTITKKF